MPHHLECQQFKASEDMIVNNVTLLTPAEKNYSQLESETLAIVLGIEHFRLILLGHQFELETDHKPLEVIFGNPSSTPPAPVQRWILRLQEHSFRVKFTRGIHNPADWMSRY